MNSRQMRIQRYLMFGSIALISSQALSESDRGYDEELPDPGFDWSISVGVGYEKIRPSLNEGGSDSVSSGSTSGSGSNINSLDARQKSENEFMPGFNVEGAYTFSNRKTQFNFSFEELGISHLFDSGTTVSLGVGTSLTSSDEVFRDPFLTNAPRQMESVRSPSLNLNVDGIFGLPVTMEYSFSRQRIKNDQAGVSLLNQGGQFGITASELTLLKRSSKSNSLIFSTGIPLSDSMFLLPSIGYHATRADGAANSSKGYDLGLQLGYEMDRYSVMVGAEYSLSKFDRSHPVFDKIREDKIVNYSVGFNVDEPFGWENQQISIGASHFDKGSNIKFYDSSESSINAGWTYHF